MKSRLLLFAILVFPTALYVFLSYGVERYKPAAIYGPRKPIEVTQKDGTKKTDTAYFTIPAFDAKRSDGGDFHLSQLNGRMYVAEFLDPDSASNGWNVGAMINFYKIHRTEFGGISFLFFWPVDSAATGRKAPDMAKEFQLPNDSVTVLEMPRARYDSLRTATYFIDDPARTKEPYTQKMYDMVLVDKQQRIRGYYNGRMVVKSKELKEDILHVRIHDEAHTTSDNMKIEQQEKK